MGVHQDPTIMGVHQDPTINYMDMDGWSFRRNPDQAGILTYIVILITAYWTVSLREAAKKFLH